MKLISARATLFRNIVDSTPVAIDPSVTCLVGKNESGKTAFLESLYFLKPAYPAEASVGITRDYPRWRKVRDEREGDLRRVFPIEAVFQVEEHEVSHLSDLIKIPLPETIQIKVRRAYDSKPDFEVVIPESDLVRVLIENSQLPEALNNQLKAISSLSECRSIAETYISLIDKRSKDAKNIAECLDFITRSESVLGGRFSEEELNGIYNLLPRFFYFSEYSPLKGRINLTDLLKKPRENLKDYEHTALALLQLAGVKGPEFMEEDFEVRIAELEAAANEISRQIFEYWTQNQDLIVNLAGDSETVSTPQGQSVVHRFVDIRLNDLRHQMTTNFETRSSGFQWFFSFIVAFSEFENDPNLIILLDEPGLGLHAKAQSDLLRFIEERLSSNSQVIYTSHSPFTVNPKHLERARLVEDLSSRENPDIGAKITSDVMSVRKDTLFPLQAALGYDLAQNLFVGGYNLIVEGPSDLIYLLLLSERLEELGLTALDPKFTIVPVGGADKIPTFIALLGSHVDITVLVDEALSQHPRIQHMMEHGLLAVSQLVAVSQVTQSPRSKLEDLFTPGEYLHMYNGAFSDDIKVADLSGNDSILEKIERKRGSGFNHLRSALALLRNRDAYLNKLTNSTLNRFEQLFVLLNKTLPSA